jgi:hypothetical protein
LSFLNKPTNPALPMSTPEYSRPYHDAHNNVLRLFFNQLQNIFDKVLGPNGGQFIDCPNGLFFNTTDQAFTANDTANAIGFNRTYLSNAVQIQTTTVTAGSFVVGITYAIKTIGTTDFTLIGAPLNTVGVVFVATGVGTGTGTADTASKIEVLVSGVYNFQYTGQLVSSSGNVKAVSLWIARNGTDISYSTRITTVKANGDYIEATWNFNIDLAAGEYIELKTSVDNHYTEIDFAAIPATSPYPAGASSVLTVNFIAPLPEPRPTLPP